MWLPAQGSEVACVVATAAALHGLHRWALSQYGRMRIDDWLWFALWEPPPRYLSCPACRWQYLPGCIRHEPCRCGLVHTRYECRYATGHTHHVPAHHGGCAPLPYDPGAYRKPRQLRRRPR